MPFVLDNRSIVYDTPIDTSYFTTCVLLCVVCCLWLFPISNALQVKVPDGYQEILALCLFVCCRPLLALARVSQSRFSLAN